MNIKINEGFSKFKECLFEKNVFKFLNDNLELLNKVQVKQLKYAKYMSILFNAIITTLLLFFAGFTSVVLFFCLLYVLNDRYPRYAFFLSHDTYLSLLMKYSLKSSVKDFLKEYENYLLPAFEELMLLEKEKSNSILFLFNSKKSSKFKEWEEIITYWKHCGVNNNLVERLLSFLFKYNIVNKYFNKFKNKKNISIWESQFAIIKQFREQKKELKEQENLSIFHKENEKSVYTNYARKA